MQRPMLSEGSGTLEHHSCLLTTRPPTVKTVLEIYSAPQKYPQEYTDLSEKWAENVKYNRECIIPPFTLNLMKRF